MGQGLYFTPQASCPQIFIGDSGNLKHPKNVKNINKTAGSHLFCCCVIPRPATVKEWEKEMFWKVGALWNLKCNKSNDLIGKILE